MTATHCDMRLLVVDDNAANVALLDSLLQRAGYRNVRCTQDAAATARLCCEETPDLVLLDLHMRERSGYEVLAEIAELVAEPEGLPVLVVSADVTNEARRRALALGARDFVTKPIDPAEALLRVHNLLVVRHLQTELRDRNEVLTETLQQRTVELEEARRESLTALAAAVEYRDHDSYEHTQRVGRTAGLIAARLGLPAREVALIRDAAPLHDIGKVGIPDRVLLKPGTLTVEEFETMKAHVAIGAAMLACARSPVLRTAADIARTHHERWDGTGYRQGLAGEDIPLCGLITAVADVFDALSHRRPYKPAWHVDAALGEILAQSGRHFDPRVVAAFATLDHRALLRDVPCPAVGVAA